MSTPTASEQTNDSSELLGHQPRAIHHTTTKARRFVPPRSIVLELSDNNDAFMEDVHIKPAIKLKDKGVVWKATGHNDIGSG